MWINIVEKQQAGKMNNQQTLLEIPTQRSHIADHRRSSLTLSPTSVSVYSLRRLFFYLFFKIYGMIIKRFPILWNKMKGWKKSRCLQIVFVVAYPIFCICKILYNPFKIWTCLSGKMLLNDSTFAAVRHELQLDF